MPALVPPTTRMSNPQGRDRLQVEAGARRIGQPRPVQVDAVAQGLHRGGQGGQVGGGIDRAYSVALVSESAATGWR
jgi:hypothetical protein